jgi:polyisoprenoid-binding protein YceI
MKKFAAGFVVLGAMALAAVSASAQVNVYKIDGAHSEADFAIKHLAISTVHGSFRGVSGEVKFDDKDFTKSSVDAVIDVNTVDTGVAARDSHLKSPDFFDTAKFPTMTFKSTRVEKAGDHYNLIGDLMLHGVTKQVTLALEVPPKPQADQKGNIHRGFTATTTIKRQDFGLLWAGKTGAGDAVLGDDVKIEIDLEAVQQK